MMSYTLYGIPNCDTVKKAKKFLDGQGVDYQFVDFKKSAPVASNIKKWSAFYGEIPVNKRGTTFRKIKESFESSSEAKQIKLMLENPSSIKRPILEKGAKVLSVGFNDQDWKEIFH